MVLTRRFWVGAGTTALACALLVGTAAGRPRSRGGKRARAVASRVAKPPPGPAAPVDTDEPLAARLRDAWSFYESLAAWQLRREMNPAAHGSARRALSIVVGLASASPGAAFTAALGPEPSVLEERPVIGGVSSGYGVRRDPFRRRRHKKHNGLDLRAERGVPVHAAGAGMVAKAERMRGYGRVVYVDHGGGIETRYAHLQRIDVREGQFVAPGMRVGRVGSSGRSTGPHLHFEVRENGRPVAPVEILGLLAVHTPVVSWIESMLDGATAEPADQAPAPEVSKARRTPRGKARRGRARKAARSVRPTS